MSLKATPVLWGKRPTDEMEQGKCLECWLSVKAGTGRCLELTSKGKDFPKPLCKTTADPAADSGTQAAALLCLPLNLTDSPHLSSSLLQRAIHKGKKVHSLLKGQAGERRRKRYHLADMICLEFSSALLYLNKHVCDVRYNNGQMGRV